MRRVGLMNAACQRADPVEDLPPPLREKVMPCKDWPGTAVRANARRDGSAATSRGAAAPSVGAHVRSPEACPQKWNCATVGP